ncbi:outer membrane protein assembly factor BamE [Yoonia sp. I 8.24]|uniref:outer membrane protein assembly factor BamE n=1 Tax=Yoonia sp. I 8.24 TaxID=1537229 RepID=UPI001EDD4C2A|nr:outer membrane protein assembly factor BamE [Yoonia sp. I 8.24]MCG3266329.1 outer membrane protein assembly factor BamE [Yoonia sp. I 8.24]
MSKTSGKFHIAARIAGVVLVLAATSACSKIDKFHGYAPSPEDLTEVTLGQTTRADVIARFGPPMSEGVIANNAVYYASSQFVHYGAFAPKEVDRQVVAIRFDENNVTQDVARYTLQDGQVVSLDRRVTDDGIQDITFIGQMLGSLGRIDAGTFLGDS